MTTGDLAGREICYPIIRYWNVEVNTSNIHSFTMDLGLAFPYNHRRASAIQNITMC